MDNVHHVCTRFHSAIELVGARWSGAILRALFTGATRFADVKAAIPGISDTMLAERLRTLEEQGLVARVPDTTAMLRPRASYVLTEKGRDLEPALAALTAWAHRWIPLDGDDDDDARHAGPTRPAAGPTRKQQR
jgi:DNA-binding HxlR family transcriptional regulator